MGDWDVLHHVFECASEERARALYARLSQAEQYDWVDDRRWALRFGFLDARVLLASTSQKYGWDLGFAEFVVEEGKGVAFTRLSDQAVLERGASSTIEFRWDFLGWLSQEEIYWSPFRSTFVSPPDDLARRLNNAVPGLRAVGGSSLVYRLAEANSLARMPDGSPHTLHRTAIHASLQDRFRDSTAENMICLSVGNITDEHGALSFGRLRLTDDDVEFEFTLGGNHIHRERWLGPYHTPIQDDLEPPSKAQVKELHLAAPSRYPITV